VIAHRGASAAHRENTTIAFREAARLGADAVEFDVRRTGDGILVIHHDDTIAGLGPIIDTEAAALRRDAPWIPTLAEAIDACAGMWMNIEIKNSPADRDWDPDDATLEGTIAHLASVDAAGRTLISSFNPRTAQRAAGRLPGLRTGLLVDAAVDPVALLPVAAGAGHSTLHAHVSSLQGPAAAHAAGAARDHALGIVAWTVDSPDEIRRLTDAGITGIITNVPDVARSVLGG
jgi:glycerophosphoryl diester phosphodiesterase